VRALIAAWRNLLHVNSITSRVPLRRSRLYDPCNTLRLRLSRQVHLQVLLIAAWRLTLDAFPTTQRMHTGTPCVACGAPEPGVQHH
jgi:hypothetical protein